MCEERNDFQGLREMRAFPLAVVGFALVRACENIGIAMDIDIYNKIRSGGTGYIEMPRGLIAVWGKEAAQFLDGLITNDVKTLEDGAQMLAAFPNAQGRLLAVVRVLRQGKRFLFETEAATREKIFNNLFRFTFAGDFFVEDISEHYAYFELFGDGAEPLLTCGLLTRSDPQSSASNILFTSAVSNDYFIATNSAAAFRDELISNDAIEISDDFYETLRIENGVPKFGVDMDETTIVPELGIDGLISYNKGCYIGQEIIARIHFRGHVAKQLTGLVHDGTRTFLSAMGQDADRNVSVPSDLTTTDGKNAGRITSAIYSPKLAKTIALAYVRYDYLAEGTMLQSGEVCLKVNSLPFL
ncbi:MAG: YgfZ/GcvT domain-containing protein [Pyrinomonadaceae bacterium]